MHFHTFSNQRRYSAQLLSLENIEAEQKATLEKIYSTAR